MASIISQLLHALHYLHTEAFIVHRDVKPEVSVPCCCHGAVHLIVACWRCTGCVPQVPREGISALQGSTLREYTRNAEAAMKKAAVANAKSLGTLTHTTWQMLIDVDFD